jgi:hypothetical protein
MSTNDENKPMDQESVDMPKKDAELASEQIPTTEETNAPKTEDVTEETSVEEVVVAETPETVAEEKVEASEETVAEEKAEASEETVAEEKAEASEETVAEEKAEASEETVIEEKVEASEETVIEEKVEASEETVAEEKVEASEETVAEEKVEASKDEVVVVENKAPEKLQVLQRFPAEAPESDELDAESYLYYHKLVAKADELVLTKDWTFISQELGIIREKWSEGPAVVSELVKSMYAAIEELEDDFKTRKQAHYERLNVRKEENLEKKKAIVAELHELIDGEKWNAQATVNKLKGRFENIRPVDRAELEKLEKQFAELVETFETKKVEIMVDRAKKEEENLAGKLYVIDKLKSTVGNLTAETKNWDDVENNLQQLAKDWKKIGRVPSEKTSDVYSQFHAALDDFYKKRMELDASYRKRMEKALARKKVIIEEAEMLIEQDDLANASQRVNILHRNWKKGENLPQKDENELWSRFKDATEKFNAYKQENLDKLREQENENLARKEAIITQAEELLTPEDWNAAADKMQALLNEWKITGPVPLKKAKQTWDTFKKVMDNFYDQRRNHFKDQRKDQKVNYDQKMILLDQMRALIDESDVEAAQKKAKEIQDEFKKLGFVPIKQKNKVWNDYREVCDKVYEHFREARKSSHKINSVVANQSEQGESDQITQKRHQRERIRQEISKLSEDIIKTKESLSYFKTDNDSNPLILDIKSKISSAEDKLSAKKTEMAELKKDIELAAKEAEKQANQESNTEEE